MLKISNYEEIIQYSESSKGREARKLLLDLILQAINAVDPYQIIKDNLKFNREEIILEIKDRKYFINQRKIWIIGGGKAAGKMAEALESILGDFIFNGIICVPIKNKEKLNLNKISCFESSHPIPSKQNIINTNKILELVQQMRKEDLVIVVLSGGGSAILSSPIPPININDLIILNKLLISSGMNIHKINTVRKHLSNIKGGRLAQKIPSQIITLVLSDVIGDNLDTIASGPLCADKSTYTETKQILEEFKLWKDKIPSSVKQVIIQGIEGKILETPKEDDPVFSRVDHFILGSNKIACKEVISNSKKHSLKVIFLSDMLEGDVQVLGKILCRIYRGISEFSSSPTVIVSGGEPTVIVKGNGIGGRNQELSAVVLAELMKNPFNLSFISFATDGIDGNSLYAGALIDCTTIDSFKEKRINLELYQANNDLTNFFKEIDGSLIITGSTGTNVMDLHIAIVDKETF